MGAFSGRYRLQRYCGRASRHPCPECGQQRVFTRYVDTENGDEVLPEHFGKCDRIDKCGYHLSPNARLANGTSYAEEAKAASLADRHHDRKHQPKQAAGPPPTIPEDYLTRSLAAYHQNNFARLLEARFGQAVTVRLLVAFEVGTSDYWPGATVFWQRDELGRVRGGQVVLFEKNGHTAKKPDATGQLRRCTTWVHTAIARRYKQREEPLPAWLKAYMESDVPKSPSLYGIQQLDDAALDRPIGIVEAPKTAILCTACFPDFIWMAVGSLGYLSLDRLRPLRGRRITLFPDASENGRAYDRWRERGQDLAEAGIPVLVSDLLEKEATQDQKKAGIDLADLILL